LVLLFAVMDINLLMQILGVKNIDAAEKKVRKKGRSIRGRRLPGSCGGRARYEGERPPVWMD
jgi:hypothetical protein